MSRILFDKTQRLSIILAEFGKFREHIGQVYRVYKFRKTGTGITRLTTQGEKDFNKYSTNKTSQFLNVYNGKAPISVIWNNSTNLSVSEDSKRIIKKYEVGDYYYMVGNNSFTVSMANDNLSLLGKDYVTQYINKTVVLESIDWIPDNDDIVDYIYMILDKRSQSYLWLELTNYEPTYNEETKEYQYGIFTFETLNTKYATTGKTILDFIQFGSMGEGYAFPLEIENEKKEVEVSSDPSRLDEFTKGTKYIQLDFLSAVGLSSIFVYGRKKITDLNRIEPTKPLFLYKSYFPSVSPFFYNTPNANYFLANDARPTKTGIWASYKENYKGNDRIGEYNILNKKEVMCGFDTGDITSTNPIRDGKYTYNLWDNYQVYGFNPVFAAFLKVLLTLSPFFHLIDFENFWKRKKTIADWLNINNMFNSPYDVFNYQYEEITKYKLTDTVGILGGIVNAFIGGLNIGWTSSMTKNAKFPMNLLIPCISYLDGKSALSNSAPVPIDIFIQDKETHVVPVSSNIMCSFKFSLTDRFVDPTNTKIGRPQGQGGDGIWDTKYIGQTTYEDGTNIHANGKPLVIEPTFFNVLPPLDYDKEDELGFIVDGLGYHAVGITDTRITTYDVNGESSYEAYFETMSKARNDPRIWKNFVKFNCYENWNTSGKINWPKDVVIPKPTEEDYNVREICNKSIFNFTTPNLGNRSISDLTFNHTEPSTIPDITKRWYSDNNDLLLFRANQWDCSDSSKFPTVGLNLTKSIYVRYLEIDGTTPEGIVYGKTQGYWKYDWNNNATANTSIIMTNKEKIIATRNQDIFFNNEKFAQDLNFFKSLDFTLNVFPDRIFSIPIPQKIDDVEQIEVEIKFDTAEYWFQENNGELIPFQKYYIVDKLIPSKTITFKLTRTEPEEMTFTYDDTLDLKWACSFKETETKQIIVNHPQTDYLLKDGIYSAAYGMQSFGTRNPVRIDPIKYCVRTKTPSDLMITSAVLKVNKI